MKIINIVGARPNFMKIAPLMAAYAAVPEIHPLLLHTGQHYDEAMSDLFFRQLGIPKPDINLGVGSGSHAVQTAQIMQAFEPVVEREKPDWVLVVGDVNSTIACGLVAVKMGVRLAHVEAGLRSFDRTMPEEINRVCTDAISHALFCTEESGVRNLLHEGVPQERIFLVGNVMIDTLLRNRAKADASDILERLGLSARGYAVLTLHRPANVDDPGVFGGILDALAAIQKDMPIVFPVHPRTRKALEGSHLGERVAGLAGLRLLEPMGYLEFLKLMAEAKLVLTDSGGIQEETTILGVPCLTLRENTERPATLAAGMNTLVGRDPARILAAYGAIRAGPSAELRAGPSAGLRAGQTRAAEPPPLWDGKAAERIVGVLAGRE